MIPTEQIMLSCAASAEPRNIVHNQRPLGQRSGNSREAVVVFAAGLFGTYLSGLGFVALSAHQCVGGCFASFYAWLIQRVHIEERSSAESLHFQHVQQLPNGESADFWKRECHVRSELPAERQLSCLTFGS